MNNAIETKDLVKRYGARCALDGLTLNVPRFSVVGLVGANGAGKTTWMMSVAGFTHLASGTVNLLGGGPFDPDVHSGRITILPQDSELPLESRPLELLTHYARLQGLSRQDAERSAATMLEAVHLGDRLHVPIRSLSHGMRKRVMIAQCFLGYPELVLLDEPLSGLDPREVSHMRNFIAQKRGSQTLVISSHNLHDIELLCTHIAFIEKGRTRRFDRLETLTGHADTVIYYLEGELPEVTALQRVVPEATLTLSPEMLTLSCRYDPAATTAVKINALLLPLLLTQCGVKRVSQGSDLETEYLKNLP